MILNCYIKLTILILFLHSYKHKEINDKVKNLKIYHSQLQAYPELFKKEGIDLVTFTYQSQNDFVLNVKKNNELIKIKVPKAYYKDQYLYPGEEIRREDNSNIWYHITKVTVTHFDYIKEYFDLDAIISRSTNVSSRKPVIVFGNSRSGKGYSTILQQSGRFHLCRTWYLRHHAIYQL